MKLLAYMAAFFALAFFARAESPYTEPDMLVFESENYELYKFPLEKYLAKNKTAWAALRARLPNPRIPRGYIASYAIKDAKLYLESVVVRTDYSRYGIEGKSPLVMVKDAAVAAEKLFGKNAKYPLFCDWFSGSIRASKPLAKDTENYLGLENVYLKIEKGRVLFAEKVLCHTGLHKSASAAEISEKASFFSPKNSENESEWIDARIARNPSMATSDEYALMKAGKTFKTRGLFTKDKRRRIGIYLEETFYTPQTFIPLRNDSLHDISSYNEGDKVEVEMYFFPGAFGGRDSRGVLLKMRHLDADENIYSRGFFKRVYNNFYGIYPKGFFDKK